jgi:endonuclease G
MARKKQSILFRMVYQLFKLIKHHPMVVSFLAIVIGGWYAYEVQIARPEQVFMGIPKSRYWHQPFTWVRIFRNANFMLGYSDLRGNPLWVSYQIKSVAKDAEQYKRPRNYTVDWRSINQVKQADYTHSGYDRGHMAPNYAISRLYGKQAQLNTFLMSNITPQTPNLNQKLWQRLEEVEIKHFTQLHDQVWVLTGPVFIGETEHLPNAINVEIPDAFYKIYALPSTTGAPKLIAFLMPQEVIGNEALTDYVTSVDAIEALTGLDFFADLDDSIEGRLEATINMDPWQLLQVANLKSRY